LRNQIKSVAVIGSGNLGKRHIQSAVYAKGITNLYAIDPSLIALKEVSSIVDQEKIKEENITFSTITNVDALPDELDLVIIATNSLIRLAVLKSVIAKCKVKYCILEKFLFPEKAQYEEARQLLSQHDIKTFVNTPRRVFSYYKSLKESINSSERNIITVSAGNLRVGTHAIHFMDLFSYLLGDIEITDIDVEGLDKKIYDSKRDGYIEMEGSIIFRAAKSTMLFQTYDVKGMPLQVSVETPGRRYIIMENNKVAYHSDDSTKWLWESNPFGKPMQSQLTNLIIDQLSLYGDCDLPKFDISSKLHQQLLDALIQKISILTGQSLNSCNIT
jgi:predicted dehydrogenase